MPSDVSDEALEKLIAASLYHDERGVFPFTREEIILFAKRVRDLTARRCLEELRGATRSPEWDEHNDALEEAAQAILALFPGSCTTEEKQDGEG